MVDAKAKLCLGAATLAAATGGGALVVKGQGHPLPGPAARCSPALSTFDGASVHAVLSNLQACAPRAKVQEQLREVLPGTRLTGASATDWPESATRPDPALQYTGIVPGLGRVTVTFHQATDPEGDATALVDWDSPSGRLVAPIGTTVAGDLPYTALLSASNPGSLAQQFQNWLRLGGSESPN